MAEHADAAGLESSADRSSDDEDDEMAVVQSHVAGGETPTTDQAIANPQSGGASTEINEVAKRLPTKRLTDPLVAIAFAAIVVVALGVVGGVLGHRIYEERQVRADRNAFVEAARQGVINLTTISAATIDTDISRVLDSTTGGFHDDFQTRSQAFAQVVKTAQTRSEGTITSAAMQSQDGDQAEVMVTVSLKMTNNGAPEQGPQSWRMLITVDKAQGGAAKVSNVQFAT